MSVLFSIVLSLLAVFIILLVLVQRGRGGGLAGALGGMGGSSAFGAKAGDLFTRITIVTAAIWIVVCLAALLWAKHRGDVLGSDSASPAAGSTLDLMPQKPLTEQGKSSGVEAMSPAAAPASPSSPQAAPTTAPVTPAAPAPTSDAATPPVSSLPSPTEKGTE
jgi:preprotein translocase subunit SecG